MEVYRGNRLLHADEAQKDFPESTQYFRLVIEHNEDGFQVTQLDYEDESETPWNATPVRTYPTLEDAIVFIVNSEDDYCLFIGNSDVGLAIAHRPIGHGESVIGAQDLETIRLMFEYLREKGLIEDASDYVDQRLEGA
jgi:hypothetical protein